MIYDCFIFHNEFRVLDIRLNELYDVVDKFVIVEADKTFTNIPKPYYLSENMSRYSPFSDKMEIIKVSIVGNTTWEREADQRNALNNYPFAEGSTIMLSDADEIPRASSVREVVEPTILFLRGFFYALNLEGPQGSSVKVVPRNKFPGGQSLREVRRGEYKGVEDSGWHFSCLMTVEEIRHKLKSFSHDELDLPQYTDADKIADRVANEMDLYDRFKLARVQIDDTWPRHILDNIDKYKEFIR